MTFEKIEKVLDKKNVKYEIVRKFGFIQLWTAHGWSKMMLIEFNGTPEGFVEKLAKHAGSYNIDEEAKELIEQRDLYAKTDKLAEKITNESLLSDCQNVKNKFMDIAAALTRLISPEATEKTEESVQ